MYLRNKKSRLRFSARRAVFTSGIANIQPKKRKAMAYNRENLLRRVIAIREIVQQETNFGKNGVTQIWVYNNVIFPKYHISYSTFNDYIAIPAPQKQLDKLLADKRRKDEIKKQQLSLFDK